jgi:hypothetical protein
MRGPAVSYFVFLFLEIKFLTFSGGLHRSGIWMVKRFEFGFEFSCLSVGRTILRELVILMMSS